MSEIFEHSCSRCKFRIVFRGFWEHFPVPRGYFESLCLACCRPVIVGYVWDEKTQNYDRNVMQVRRVCEASHLPQIINHQMLCKSHQTPPEQTLLYHHGAERFYELIDDLPQAPCPECGVVGRVILGLQIGQRCPLCGIGVIQERK